jgi:biopolymer transport protein ExbB
MSPPRAELPSLFIPELSLESASYGLIQIFHDGGGMMYPLLLASRLGVIIAKAYILWAARRDTNKVLSDVTEMAKGGRLDDALAYLQQTPGPVAAVLLAGLNRIRDTRETSEIEQAMTTTGKIEIGFLERGMVVLATVATVAPLLGFLGTVWGMIAAFAAIELAGQVEATLVAAGIKIALITTAAGLVIAIPINIAYNVFVTRIDALILDMEQGTTTVMNLLWDVFSKKEGRGALAGAAPSAARASTQAGEAGSGTS